MTRDTIKTTVFVWDNFGPMHADRCDAVARRLAGTRRVVGIELASKSETYDWFSEVGSQFKKITLLPGGTPTDLGIARRASKIIQTCVSERASEIFMCHYEHPATLIAGAALRLLRRQVFTMGCSKFDDYQRNLTREALKSLYFLPYQGGISSGTRARDYMRFLGLREDRIKTEYNTLSIARIRNLAGIEPAPGGTRYDDRHFTIIARFVPKKNLYVALDAYSEYCKNAERPRSLHLCGSGPLEEALRKAVEDKGLSDKIVFRGFVQTEEVARTLGSTLALLLPSIEEQFGNVVIEAQAMGLPVILSDNCGARDLLVRSGVNGFVVEPDNSRGKAFFMSMLAENERLWRDMSGAAAQTAILGDTERFADAVEHLLVPIAGVCA